MVKGIYGERLVSTTDGQVLLGFYGGIDGTSFSTFSESPIDYMQLGRETIHFNTAEQFFQWSKARHFNDSEAEKRILAETKPFEQKKAGYKIAGFNMESWKEVRYSEMVKVLVYKYRQNESLFNILKATDGMILAEATAYDNTWGTGFALHHPELENIGNWPGESLMGKALMEVRSKLIAEAEVVEKGVVDSLELEMVIDEGDDVVEESVKA